MNFKLCRCSNISTVYENMRTDADRWSKGRRKYNILLVRLAIKVSYSNDLTFWLTQCLYRSIFRQMSNSPSYKPRSPPSEPFLNYLIRHYLTSLLTAAEIRLSVVSFSPQTDGLSSSVTSSVLQHRKWQRSRLLCKFRRFSPANH